MTRDEIIKENKVRLSRITGEGYEPLTGVGSPIERFSFNITPEITVRLPEPMKKLSLIQAALKFDSLRCFYDYAFREVKKHVRKKHVQRELDNFHKTRIPYDFEFWAATCAWIKDRAGKPTRFILNHPQLILLDVLEHMRLRGVPIRVVLLKARQWGGSTLVQIYEQYIMLFVETGFSSAVATHVEASASHIRGMFNYMAESHPKDVLDVQLLPYENTKHRVVKGRKNIIGVGSYEKPENLRGFTFQLLHLSEVASMRETIGKTPEGFAQALRAFVPSRPNTMVVLESTAKGVGSFFHREWQKAKEKDSGYEPVFIPWFLIPEYIIKLSSSEKSKIIQKILNPKIGNREREFWQLGATLEGIAWYYDFKKRERYEDHMMMEEFPSTAEEAFVSSGQRVFPQRYTLPLREDTCAPEEIGELQADAQTGPDALKDIRFVKNPHGRFWVWTPPDRKAKHIRDRYVLFVDIGGTKKEADKSVISVLDRYWMMEGGKPEFVATWRGNIDHDILAWKAAQIAAWYLSGLLIVESNSLDKHSDGSGHFFTVLDEIAEYYPNLFARTDPDKIKEGAPVKYGFHTDRKTKPQIIDALIAAARDREYIEKDDRAVDEMDTFERKDDGRLGAQDGCHDDLVITRAGCVWAALKYLPPPKYADEKHTSERRTIISEASL